MILCLSLTGNAHHQSDNYEASYCKWRHSLGVFLRKPYMVWRTDGVYASGHPELAQLYWQPILDGMPAARRGAADRAKANNLSHCASTALHYNAHISPWGFGDFDVRQSCIRTPTPVPTCNTVQQQLEPAWACRLQLQHRAALKLSLPFRRRGRPSRGST